MNDSITGSQLPEAATNDLHTPVLVREVIEHLNLNQAHTIIDATLGLGGHTAAILDANATVRVLGFDRDSGSLRLAETRLQSYGARFTAYHGDFARMDQLAPRAFNPSDGVLMDLGISSWQLATRGFSFNTEAPLDFRMDPETGVTAADFIRELPEHELADLIYQNGDERRSRRIAAAIVAARKLQSITTTTELAEVISQAIGRHGRLHPATKTFQALRIAVNDELGSLRAGLIAAERVLRPGGRLVVITFHSLEDRLAKRHIAESAGLVKVNKKVIQPARSEILNNPRARSAKLRIAERT